MEEKEIKILLDKEQYEKAVNLFAFNYTVNQINHYYYGKCAKERKITVRVREIDGCFYLQMKVPVSREKSLHISNEYEKKLECLPQVISSQTIKEISGIDMDDCRYIGSLETMRKVCNYNDNTEICVDRNNYLDKEDYELEVEYKGELDGSLYELITTHISSVKEKTNGKVSRFMNEYKKHGTEK